MTADGVIYWVQSYTSNSLSEGLCLFQVLQQVLDAGEGIQQFSSGQLCWRPLDDSSSTLPPGQPRQGSTSCTSLRAASAGYCMDQHKWLSWKRLLALAPRQRYLELRGRGGRNGRSEEKRPVNAITLQSVGRERERARSFWVLVLLCPVRRGSTHKLWRVQAQLAAARPRRQNHPPHRHPLPAPHRHRAGVLRAGTGRSINSRYGDKMGDEGLVRRGRSNTGARPPPLGKEAVLAPRRVCSPRERGEADRAIAGPPDGRSRGRGAGRRGWLRGELRGGGGRPRLAAGSGRRVGMRGRQVSVVRPPPLPHFLPPPRRRGLGAGLAGQPAPGAAPPGEGRARKSALPRARQGLPKGAGLGKRAMLLLWQELVCNKSLEHFPCERE